MESYLHPETTLRHGTTLVSTDVLRPNKVVGFYFSAHWCGPCLSFTPLLAHFYKRTKETCDTDFVVVFVSADRKSAGFEDYYATMPWLAVQFADVDTREHLNTVFDISSIPALVLVNADGSCVKKNGRDLVSQAPRYFPWGMPDAAGTVLVKK